MDMLLLIVLAGAVAWLWNRVDTLERRLRWLQDGLDALHGAPSQADLPAPETAGQEAARGEPKPQQQPTPPPPERTSQDAIPLRDRIAALSAKSAAAGGEQDQAQAPEEDQAPARSFLRRPNFNLSLDFENIFGRLLPIWAGGIALAIAGFFLVRWSIENGLLNETVRVALGFVFGAALIAAAEAAHRFQKWIADERIRQALAGAGLATLYASFYLAGTQYGLIGGTVAFAGLAAVTALAVLLSFRFGLPSAVLGLVGGFAAPALAGSTDPNLPLLATYLALVTGGLAVTGRKQQRSWLGIAALAGGLGWGALMLVSGPVGDAGIMAVGGYMVLLGTLLPSLMGTGALGKIGRIAACGAATLQIAILVDQSGYSLLAWGAYVLLAAAIAVLGWQNHRLREAGAVAAGLSACLIAAWPDPAHGWLALISAAMAAIFIGAPLAHIVREKALAIDWGQLALYPAALIAALCIQLWLPLPESRDMIVALAALALAIAPAIAAWLNWPAEDAEFAQGPFAALASASTLLVVAGLLATPAFAAPFVTAAVAAGLFGVLHRHGAALPRALQWAVAMAGAALLLTTAEFSEFARLAGGRDDAASLLAAARWIAAALPFALLSPLPQPAHGSRAAQCAAVILAYGALAQIVGADWMGLTLAIGVLALAWKMRWRAAHATALTLSALWGLPALLMWSWQGIQALTGDPMMMPDADQLDWTLRTAVPLAIGWGGSLLLAPRFMAARRWAGWAVTGAIALVTVHSVFKMLFGIADMPQFAAQGLAERTVWQALLVLPAMALLSFPEKWQGQRRAGASMAIVALAHFAIFTLGWHNPLWSIQAVGNLPLANLLWPAYGLAIAATLTLRRQLTGAAVRLAPVMDGAVMALAAFLALSELRHAYAGYILVTSGVGQQEDLLRSILAIGLALGFLGWGARSKQRSWRIGSLLLMLLAVTKVFLFDAAGLEGLARIASFFALGLCLIGIGWFYTRQLTGGKTPPPMAEDQSSTRPA